MREMQTTVTDVCGVCLSVCRAAQLGFTVQDRLNGSKSGVNTLGGLLLHAGPDPPQRGEGYSMPNYANYIDLFVC